MHWFKHDADARNSLKLRKIRRKYGADGYAIYWFCLEAIAYGVNKDNLTFDLKEDAETIGFELAIQEKRVEEIMMYMVEIGLFENSNQTITCLKLAERLDKSMTNSPKMRAWLEDKGVQKVSKSVMTLPDKVKTCHELEEDKIRLDKNKIIIKENKDGKSKRFVKPKLDEVIEYCKERNNSVDANTFIDHYESNGWKVGKNPMKDWKACIRTWEKRNQQPVKQKANQTGFDIDFMDAQLYEDRYP